jgi:hypothetical protein
MTKHVAPCLSGSTALGLTNCYSEWIVGIVLCRCHGESNHQRSFVIKNAWREHQKGVEVSHFLTDLRITVNPYNILTIRHPRTMLA